MCYTVQTSDIPVGWQPECVLLEGMFLINSKALGMHKCLADYANFLLARHVATQFSRGAIEVHIIFDNPGRLRRHDTVPDHAVADISVAVSVVLPADWVGLEVGGTLW